MLDMSLGAGIMWAGLFLTLGPVAVVWINNVYRSRQGCSLEDSSQSQGQSQSQSELNGYIRRGEYNQRMTSIDKQLSDMHKENKGWWKQLNGKVDELTGELRKFTDEQRQTNKELHERITAIETVQENCPARLNKGKISGG